MPICRTCGVEVDDGIERCPLCGQAMVAGAKEVSAEPPRSEPRPAPGALRRWLLEAVTILAVAGSIVVFAADFAYRMDLTWAPYPLAAIAFLWLSAVTAILAWRRRLLWLACQTLTLLAFLYALDALTPGPPWFLPLALPATLLAVVLLSAAIAVIRRLARAPLPATAVALLAVGVFLLGLELLLSRFSSRALYPGWSLVAFGCILPVVLVLLSLHRWAGRNPEVRKRFHL